MRILLVENNLGDARLVQELLRDIETVGAEFTHVTRIGDALDALSQHHFDVVLLDLSLPDGTGVISAQRILASQPRVPVVIMSGEDSEDTAMLAVQEGAEDYLIKGQVDGFQLLRAVRYAIHRHSRTQRLAHHDPLTGLANRLLFDDRLRQAVLQSARYNVKLAVLFIDLDGFKDVNDAHGHDAGDAVLRAVAERFATGLRHSDTLARLGGDEFTVILPSIHVPEDAARTAQRIIHALKEPIQTRNAVVRVGASIGISFFPQDADGPDALLQCADEAMYRAKKRGKNCYEFHSVDPSWLPQHSLL